METVDRDEEFFSDLAMDPADLVSVRVSGSVDLRHFGMDDLGALAGKIVFYFLHAHFVARDNGRGEKHRIVFRDLEMALAVGPRL